MKFYPITGAHAYSMVIGTVFNRALFAVSFRAGRLVTYLSPMSTLEAIQYIGTLRLKPLVLVRTSVHTLYATTISYDKSWLVPAVAEATCTHCFILYTAHIRFCMIKLSSLHEARAIAHIIYLIASRVMYIHLELWDKEEKWSYLARIMVTSETQAVGIV
jgi:hypothetical protein